MYSPRINSVTSTLLIDGCSLKSNVSGESIMEVPLVAPPSGILDAFNRDHQPLLDRILSNHGESRTLATLRDTLLPKLLSGELSVAGGIGLVESKSTL